MDVGRCQSVNFGMNVDTRLVQGRNARRVADKLATWLSPINTSAVGVVRGDHHIKLSISNGGQRHEIKFPVAGADLGSIVTRVKNTVGIA